MNKYDMFHDIVCDAARVGEALNDPSTDVRIAAMQTIATSDLMAAHDALRDMLRRFENQLERT